MATPSPSAAASFPQVRLLLAAFAGVVALLVAAYFLIFRQEYELIYKDLRPGEASAIVADLSKHKVPFKLRAKGTQILVPENRADATRLDVADNVTVKGMDGFELFNSADMGLTDFAQRIKYQRALQGEIARTIMAIEGIAEARVHITMSEPTSIRGGGSPAKAAVTLTTRSGEPSTPAQIEGVQRLVAAAVPNLIAQDVAVLNARGEIVSLNAETVPASENTESGSIKDRILAILHQLDPQRSFQIQVKAAAPVVQPPASAAKADEAATNKVAERKEEPRPPAPQALTGTITITTHASLPQTEQDRIRSGIRSDVSVGSLSNASLAFLVDPADAIPSPLPPAPPKIATPATAPLIASAAPSSPASSSTLLFGPRTLGWIGLGVAAMITVMVIVLVSLRSIRPILSVEEQQRFAEKLRLSLRSELEGISE